MDFPQDPEFYEFLKEHDKELLEFEDEDEEELHEKEEKELSEFPTSTETVSTEKALKPIHLSSGTVEAWCKAVKEKQHFGAVRNILRAFQSACHYGDGGGDNLSAKFNIGSSHVFNKIMVFVLSDVDAVFKRHLAHGEGKGPEKDLIAQDLPKNVKWKKVEPLVRSYLGNALHILNQMTDNQMIAFTLRRLKASIVFIGAFTRLARKYLKATLHFWGSGEGALPLIAFVFIREMAIQLGTDYLEACLKGIYKEYTANSRFVNATSLPHIHFMANCAVELFGIDLAVSYQNSFVFIRQMAIVLRNALTVKTKEAFKSVYSWQFMNSLSLWVKVVCTYPGKDGLQPLVYPLAQIIGGVARLLPTARYFPLRLHCALLLNKLSSVTNSFIPVSSLLLDMLQFRELHKPPTGGVGRAVDFQMILKVPKLVLKTRAFQEGCVFAVIEQLTEHLAQWSYSIAFPELALVPLVQLRRFVKESNVDRFRRQVKQLVEQVEKNIEFVSKKRDGVAFSPKDFPSASMFLQDESGAGASPLSQYSRILRQLAEQRRSNIHGSSMLVGEGDQAQQKQGEVLVEGEDESEDGDKAEKIFSKDWLPEKKTYTGLSGERLPTNQSGTAKTNGGDNDDDVLEDLLLSSDDEEMHDNSKPLEDARDEEHAIRYKSPISVHQKMKQPKKKNWQKIHVNSGHRPGRMRKKRA
ncbi:hypothetical protein O6H91_Y523000 [Diphasiastrum complanatum]|nr:hypothetical protein O6H91_Y523000 [Diphasiastrum complanatum]